ncbi:hybrid sensor histidine kinase/response regulator [uncultured Vibrio sp.]|mgnify:CR=1 FL=1|uniref:response regulator n=1 Tax=uncultured Vibrio sp. TaxID=114054 RepID=UPI0025D579D8|nr:hybrid sensor histidine kinase/response regulator [uncultured Vibrio sp.]
MDYPSKVRLLLVEDSKVNQQFAQGLLEDIGFTVVIAQHGGEAIKQLLRAEEEEPPFSLVLMDCEMPVMNGYEATKNIRQGKAGDTYRQVPIIAMTASSTLGDEKTCYTAGMNDHLAKPISTEKLQLKLNGYLSSPSSTTLENENNPSDDALHSPAPLIWDRENALYRLNYNDEYMVLIVNTFLESIPAQIETLEAGMNANDLVTVRMEFHSFKGVAGNISAMAFMAISGDMEKWAREKRLAKIVEKWPQFMRELEQLKSVLRAYIEEVS